MGPEIIHYLPQKIDFLGTTVHMQTLYMSWLTMAIVIIIVAAYPYCSGGYEPA